MRGSGHAGRCRGSIPTCDGPGRSARGPGVPGAAVTRVQDAVRMVGVSKGTSLIHSHLQGRRCGLSTENLPAPGRPPGSPVRVSASIG